MRPTMRPLRPVILEQAPGRTGDPARPLQGGRVGRRLAEACNVLPERLADVFELANLLPAWPGSAGEKGDLFPMGAARAAAAWLLPALDGHHVVLLGRRVVAAFDLEIAEPLRWHHHEWDGGVMAVALLPHPSGVNLWWNGAANRAAARAFMSELARRAAGWGTE